MLQKKSVPILRGVHWAAHRVLRWAGFQWEVRRSGELQIGLWRRSTGNRVHRERGKYAPKRFVLVPGFGDTPLSWLSPLILLRSKLIREFDEVVLMDFPGFGGFLSKDKGFHSMDLLIGAIEDVFDSLRPHTILGHSLGGWLTAQYASSCGAGLRPKISAPTDYQEYGGPESIILVEPAGVFHDEDAKNSWARKFRESGEKGFSALRPYLFRREPFWFRWVEGEYARFMRREEIVQFMQSVREEHFLAEKISRIRCRVWLLWGESDRLIEPATISTWLGLLNTPEKEALLIQKAGHTPQLENPVGTASSIARALKQKPLLESRASS